MKPIDPRELMDEALLHARRLSKVLGMMAPGSLGTAGSVTHYDRREAHIAAVASMCVDLEEAMKKETRKCA